MTPSRRLQALLFASFLVFSVSVAAHAGTVYVPLPGVVTVGTSTYEVQVAVTNQAAVTRDVSQISIANGADGTQRGTQTPIVQSIPATQTVVLRPQASFRGLLELTGEASLRVAARLAPTGATTGPGTFLPLISSDTLSPANQPATIQGLVGADSRSSDLALVNLGKFAADCTVSFARADGSVVGSPATVTLPALSLRYFSNVFAILGASGFSEARASVVCSRDFYAYGLLFNTATGEVAFRGPSGRGESSLTVPGSEAACPPGASCFDVPGVFAQPISTNPTKRVAYVPPAGTYHKVRMTLDIYHNGWSSSKPSALHQLFWLVKNTNTDMIGYGTLRGPNSFVAQLWHGIGLTNKKKIKVVKPFQAAPGHTYHIDYTWDAGGHAITWTISEGTQVLLTATSAPNVGSLAFGTGDTILLDTSFPGTNTDEAASLGWVYSNLHLELSP